MGKRDTRMTYKQSMGGRIRGKAEKGWGGVCWSGMERGRMKRDAD